MKIDTKKDIIKPAWNLIKDDSKIKKMQFLPGVLSIFFLSALLAYQIIYTYSVLAEKKEELLEKLLSLIHSTYIVEFIIIALIFIMLYIIILPVFEGALIKYISKKDTSGQGEVSDSLSVGLYKFLPLFKYNNLFSEFKFIAVLNGYLFILRFFEFKFIITINYVFLVIFLLSVIINIIFAYSKYIIILENTKIFYAIGMSIKITFINIKNTFKLYFIMFILNVRVIFNLMVFLIFPILVVAVIGFVSTKILKTLAIIVILGIFLMFIIFLGYITGILEALKTAIWYYAYKKGKQRLEDIEKNK